MEMGGKTNGNDPNLQGGHVKPTGKGRKEGDAEVQHWMSFLAPAWSSPSSAVGHSFPGAQQRRGVEWLCFSPDLMPPSESSGSVPAVTMPTLYHWNNPLRQG